jgi:hypothetical protein
MQNQRTPVLDRPESAQASPVVDGWPWFDAQPFAVCINLPLSLDEMVAALYRAHSYLESRDLVTSDDVRGHVALEVVLAGLAAVQDTVESIGRLEAMGRIESADWLALCRQRVRDVFGTAVETPAA